MISLEELKQYFDSQDLPVEIRIAPHMYVTNINEFLRVSFNACESWKKELDKCPSYLMLIKFKEALEIK
ncbi:DUF6965 family protein [Sphingobacterium spiritivorum]|uniref:DUF6965 family protein n=1 Tax=Sphingobacterium spiritivorum TaxID=258 RepID=UPI003DA1DA70